MIVRIIGLQEAPKAPQQPTPPATVPPVALDLDSLTIAELKDYADGNGISLGEATKKDAILDVIKGAAAV